MSRPRITWHPKCSCGWAGPSQPSVRKAGDVANSHALDCKEWRIATIVYALVCDCGWTYRRGIKTDCEQQATWHRQGHA